MSTHHRINHYLATLYASDNSTRHSHSGRIAQYITLQSSSTVQSLHSTRYSFSAPIFHQGTVTQRALNIHYVTVRPESQHISLGLILDPKHQRAAHTGCSAKYDTVYLNATSSTTAHFWASLFDLGCRHTLSSGCNRPHAITSTHHIQSVRSRGACYALTDVSPRRHLDPQRQRFRLIT